MEGKPKPRLSEAQRRRQRSGQVVHLHQSTLAESRKFRHNPCRVAESQQFHISQQSNSRARPTILQHWGILWLVAAQLCQTSPLSSSPPKSFATGGQLKRRIGTTQKAVGWTNPKRWKLLMTLKIWWVTQRPRLKRKDDTDQNSHCSFQFFFLPSTFQGGPKRWLGLGAASRHGSIAASAWGRRCPCGRGCSGQK